MRNKYITYKVESYLSDTVFDKVDERYTSQTSRAGMFMAN